jgi:hypothetical protein
MLIESSETNADRAKKVISKMQRETDYRTHFTSSLTGVINFFRNFPTFALKAL